MNNNKYQPLYYVHMICLTDVIIGQDGCFKHVLHEHIAHMKNYWLWKFTIHPFWVTDLFVRLLLWTCWGGSVFVTEMRIKRIKPLKGHPKCVFIRTGFLSLSAFYPVFVLSWWICTSPLVVTLCGMTRCAWVRPASSATVVRWRQTWLELSVMTCHKSRPRHHQWTGHLHHMMTRVTDVTHMSYSFVQPLINVHMVYLWLIM